MLIHLEVSIFFLFLHYTKRSEGILSTEHIVIQNELGKKGKIACNFFKRKMDHQHYTELRSEK